MKKNNIIILISGKQGSGKTTLAKNLCKEIIPHRHAVNLRVMKFADPLYEIHSDIFDTLNRYGYKTDRSKVDGDLLQDIGTWGRRRDPLMWTTIMRNRVIEELGYNDSVPNVIIIDDARFANEIELFDDMDAQILKVRLEAAEHTRMGRAAKWRDRTYHPSETALDAYNKWSMIVFSDTHEADEVCELVWRRVQEVQNAK